MNARDQYYFAQAQAQAAATAKMYQEMFKPKVGVTAATGTPESAAGRLKRTILDAKEMQDALQAFAGPNPWEGTIDKVLNCTPVAKLTEVLAEHFTRKGKSTAREKELKLEITLQQEKTKHAEIALKAMQLAGADPNAAKAGASMPSPPSPASTSPKKPATPDEHDHAPEDEDEDPPRIHPDDLKKIDEHDLKLAAFDAKMDQVLAALSRSTSGVSLQEPAHVGTSPAPPSPRREPAHVGRSKSKVKKSKVVLSLDEMKSRTLRAVELASEQIPTMKKLGNLSDTIKAISEAMDRHKDRIPGIYAEMIVILKSPPKDDGIGQIVKVIRTVNESLPGEWSKAETGAAVGVAKADLDEPEIRAKLPGVLRECVKILEG